MSPIEQEINSFAEFALRHVGSGNNVASIDELFDEWRAENPSDAMHAENVRAVQASIDDFRRGERGTPAGEHSAQLRREFGIASE
jgi:hypothetical protein